MRKPAASKAAGSRKTDVAVTSVALRAVPRAEATAEEPPAEARRQAAIQGELFRERRIGADLPAPATMPPDAYRPQSEASGLAESRAEAQISASGALFRLEGEYWHIAYAGRGILVRSLKGLLYLRYLLQSPGEKIHVTTLTALGDQYEATARYVGSRRADRLDVPPKSPLVVNDAGDVIDARATWEYRHRLDELRSELKEASQWGDIERASSIRREIDFITSELAAAYGLGSRARRLDSQVERMRKAVTNRIHDGIVRVSKQNPALGRHLSNAVRTGLFCCYSPESDVWWKF